MTSALHWRSLDAKKQSEVRTGASERALNFLNGDVYRRLAFKPGFECCQRRGGRTDSRPRDCSIGHQPQCPNSGVHSLIPTAAGLGQTVLVDRLADPVRRHTAPDLFARHRSAVCIAQDALLHRDGGASDQEQGAEYRGYGFHAPFLARPANPQRAVELKRQRDNRLSDIAAFVREHILAPRSRHGH